MPNPPNLPENVDATKKQRIESLEDQIIELAETAAGNQQAIQIVGETVREMDGYLNDVRTAVYEGIAAEINSLKERVAKLEG